MEEGEADFLRLDFSLDLDLVLRQDFSLDLDLDLLLFLSLLLLLDLLRLLLLSLLLLLDHDFFFVSGDHLDFLAVVVGDLLDDALDGDLDDLVTVLVICAASFHILI